SPGRGQGGWLGLPCTTLSFAAPHRFIPAHPRDFQPRRSIASLRMLAMPQAGPRASTGKAQRQPTWLARGGTSWIETVVSRNPAAVWTVRAVPTACGGTDSVTRALNWALSAMTKKPQVQASRVTRARLAPKRKPMVRAQVPLAAKAMVTR